VLAITLISFAMAGFLYSRVPDILASHWNAKGEVDGYTPKFWALFLMPFISLVMFLAFVLVPKLDPLKANVEKFRSHFDRFMVILVLFFFYVFVLTIIWNLGKEFNMTVAIMPAFSLIFYFSGILIENTKRNWFIGLRTPWTLSSDRVWDKTHKLGGKLFKALAVISLCGLLFRAQAILFFLIPVCLVITYITWYSHAEYKKEKK